MCLRPLPQILSNRFNRYMVECEYCITIIYKHTFNSFNRYMVECESENVQSGSVTDSCFNRYMVECECCNAGTTTLRHVAF